jgi:hypothetical protein
MDDIDTTDTSEHKQGRHRLYRVVGIILIAVAVLLATYSIVFYTAWQDAQSEREQNERRVLQEELEKQFSLARDDINAGNLDLAMRRLEWILNLSPGYPGASELKAITRSGMFLTQTPASTPINTPSPKQTPELIIGTDPAIGIETLRKLMNEEQWMTLTSEVPAFQAAFPNYLRHDTDTMFFTASINYGLELLQGEQVELGLYHLSQAERLGDLPQEVEDYRTWAELYLLGIGFFGVDWGQAILNFRGLCAAAPYYQDSCVRLYESLLALGDLHAAISDWCPAEELYFEAALIETSDLVRDKLNEAELGCSEATPTPTTVITGTATIVSTPTGTPD